MNLLPSDILQVTTSATATVDAVAFWHDDGNRAVSNRTRNAFTVAATKTLVAAPGNSRTITGIAIRNTGATSVTVTVKLLYDGSSAVTLYATALAAGGQLHYDEGAGWSVTTPTTIGVTFTLIAPDDVANAETDTLADFTGLTFDVAADRTYRFRAVCDYTADATTSGSRWTVNGPAMTTISYRSVYSLTTSTQTLNPALDALQLPAAANATSADTVGNIAIIEGFFTPSAAGTFAVQFAAEAGTITGKAGSTLDYAWVLGA
jgi:hypothetical protein